MATIEFDGAPAQHSRLIVATIAVSFVAHVAVLAWLPPLVRNAGQALPSILEVRLAAESPAPSHVAPRPSVTQSAPAQKQPHVAPSLHTGATVAAMAPSLLPSVPAPAMVQALEANPVPRFVPNPEPAALTPPDLRAAYLSNPRPLYPLAARRLGLEGRVVLRAEILEDGNCGHIAVAQSSGHEVLDQAALQAVKQWRFVPAHRGGEVVTAWVEVPISFRLEDARRG